jgi:hypothetical protein
MVKSDPDRCGRNTPDETVWKIARWSLCEAVVRDPFLRCCRQQEHMHRPSYIGMWVCERGILKLGGLGFNQPGHNIEAVPVGL